MMSRLIPLSVRRLCLTAVCWSALSAQAAMAQVAPPPVEPADAAAVEVSARIDGVLADADAVRALPGNVLCRNEALQAGGTWLLVSRSWGGSPHLRHHQLVAWAAGQPVPMSGRMAVKWRECGPRP